MRKSPTSISKTLPEYYNPIQNQQILSPSSTLSGSKKRNFFKTQSHIQQPDFSHSHIQKYPFSIAQYIKQSRQKCTMHSRYPASERQLIEDDESSSDGKVGQFDGSQLEGNNWKEMDQQCRQKRMEQSFKTLSSNILRMISENTRKTEEFQNLGRMQTIQEEQNDMRSTKTSTVKFTVKQQGAKKEIKEQEPQLSSHIDEGIQKILAQKQSGCCLFAWMQYKGNKKSI